MKTNLALASSLLSSLSRGPWRKWRLCVCFALIAWSGFGFQLLQKTELPAEVNPRVRNDIDDSSVANPKGGYGIGVGALEVGTAFRLIGITRNGSDIVVTFQAELGAKYRLERKLNLLTDSTWQSIPGVNDLTAPNNGPAQITDPGAVGLGRAFYRVTESTAIFVDFFGGNDGNAGTMLSPKRTLAAGIAAAAAANPVRNVYVSKGTYGEAVTLSNGVSLYGGYDAATGWTRSSTNITTISSPGPIAISGNGLSAAVTLDQFTVVAANASGNGAGGEGLSSYGVLILNSPGGVTLRALSITAGNGTAGQAGSTGGTGSAGGIGGNALGTTHGISGSSPCGATGGQGGDGVNGVSSGIMGAMGTTVSGGGTGASGGNPGSPGICDTFSTTNGGSAPAVAANGGAGTGAPGGAPNLALGVLNTSNLYLPPSGGSGGVGFTGGGGAGGGSGGGTASGTNFVCTNCSALASGGGGGGGGGGCGGLGGAGGRGGGGSFAVAIVNSVVTIDATNLTAAIGGNGESGGNGGGGGVGGTPGSGAPGQIRSNSCTNRHAGDGASGSSGGPGGQGGGGAGGSGGPSICVFYKGIAPTTNGLMFTTGSVGQGGAGGQGMAQAQPGPSGVSGTIVASN